MRFKKHKLITVFSRDLKSWPSTVDQVVYSQIDNEFRYFNEKSWQQFTRCQGCGVMFHKQLCTYCKNERATLPT